MKTAVSIPDELFRAADKLAKQLELSRSELYARAIAAYIESRGGTEVTNALDSVYKDEESSLDPLLLRMQVDSLPREDW